MDEPVVIQFAIMLRHLIMQDSHLAFKIIMNVRDYVLTGECNSNDDKDSVCGGVCPICSQDILK